MRKLTKTEMTGYHKRWKREAGTCALCEQPLDDDTVVDHNHETGEIRAVLHRWCNSVLGKVEHYTGRLGQGRDKHTFIKNVVPYLERPGKGVMYYSHKTEDEKRLAKNAKARRARAKAKRQQESE
jgi:hypothetical protein